VVAGQRLMQAASDIFLGWMTGKPEGRHFYWRQLRDMKGSIEVELLKAPGLGLLADICGWTLARGHARSGQRIAIASYLGTSGRFDQAIADFAVRYADQAEKDYEAVLKAIKQGKIPVESGV
jgi:predicted alpha/beta hydrolase